MSALKGVKRDHVIESSYGVCLWDIEGKYLSDGDGYLSLEGFVGDVKVEEKMRAAAYYWLEENKGHPKWIPGVRKISDIEWKEQQDRLVNGLIPDPLEEIKLAAQRRQGKL
jgi:hypothetical protein